MPGVFVTATGTDVGKTYVACGLIRAARRAGLAVDALKPILSGYIEAEMDTSDAGMLLHALGRPVTAATVDAISPWRFAAPLSPDLAAAAEGRTIDVEAVVTACHAAVRQDRLTFIEGVGGVMVPLDRRHTILDLIAALAQPIVLVSATGLGAISHCLTAVAALHGRGFAPAMIVLDETAGSTVPPEATRATIAAFCQSIAIRHVARDSDDTTFDALLTDMR